MASGGERPKGKMRKWVIALAVVIVIGVIVFHRLTSGLPDYIRDRAVSTLREHFDCDVTFKNFQVSIFPEIQISGEELVLRQQDKQGFPPLITIRRFSTRAGLLQLVRKPSHVRRVSLDGLKITVPPREKKPKTPEPSPPKGPPPFSVVVDEIVSNNSELDMLPRDSRKLPRIFYIQHLSLAHAGLGEAMSFRARLTNPQPPGQIDAQGHFGPWQKDDPSLTPMDGQYTFAHANLDSIKGLGGFLSSKGKFTGLLQRVDVLGETDTPDFSLDLANHPVHLRTEFHAIVDGTTGNTLLDPVRAKIESSPVAARGGVFRATGVERRTVLLDATGTHAKLEDLLRLAVKAGTPPLTGWVNFKTRIDIPPGGGSISDRLKLDGRFDVSSARFSKLNVQQKLLALSRRGRGAPEEQGQGSVVFDLRGKFVLRNGLMTFSNLTFGVPGALVQLNGTYQLRGEAIDFRGTLRLQAKLSQTVGGWKSILLKPVDPLFAKRGAGTFVPIKVTGTGSDPQFGVEIGRVFKQ